MAELKSAFQAAWDRYFKGVSKASKFNDVLANAAITETQFYARERLAKNLLESRAARLSSRFGRNGIVKGNPVGLMATASLPTTNGINKADAILQQRMARVAHSLPPTNFFPPAVIQSKALLPKALRGMFHDEPSGVLDTDQIASDNILEEKLKRLDRIRAFGRATKASGFSRYAKAEAQLNEDIDKRNEYERERATNARLAESRGSIRNRKERLMLMRELPAFFRNSKMSTKDLRSMAKGFRQISKIPIIGALARNPALGAITALIGGGLSAGSYSLSRSGTLAKWMNALAVTGDIDQGTFHGLAATGMSYEQMLQSLAKYSVKSSEARFGGGFDKYAELAKYGVDVSGLFNPYLTAEERRAEEYRVVSSANQADRAAIMSTLGMSPEEYRSERLKNTARSEWSFSDLQLDIYQGVTKKMKENHPILDFFIPDKFYQFHSLLAANKELEDRKFFGDKAVDSRKEIYNLHRWDEIRETAEIDDRYRAGMYDNSTTNNNGGDRSVTVIQNINAEVKDSDPVGFVKEMTLLGGRGKHEAESVLQNNDSLRTN